MLKRSLQHFCHHMTFRNLSLGHLWLVIHPMDECCLILIFTSSLSLLLPIQVSTIFYSCLTCIWTKVIQSLFLATKQRFDSPFCNLTIKFVHFAWTHVILVTVTPSECRIERKILLILHTGHQHSVKLFILAHGWEMDDNLRANVHPVPLVMEMKVKNRIFKRHRLRY